MKFALVLLAALAAPTSAVFSRESASDDSSVTEVPCPGNCPLRYDPVCATFDQRHYYFSFTNYCIYRKCLCTLNYPMWLVPMSQCFFTAVKARNTCPARGKLRQLQPEDAPDLSYSPPQARNNGRSTTPPKPASWEQSGEVFD